MHRPRDLTGWRGGGLGPPGDCRVGVQIQWECVVWGPWLFSWKVSISGVKCSDSHFKLMFIVFTERRREGEREAEKH